MGRRLGEAYVEFKERGLSNVTTAGKKATHSLKQTAGMADAVSTALGNLAARGAAKALEEIVSATGALFRVMDKIDELGKNASKLGFTPGDLGTLQFAAEQSGVSAQNATTAIQRMIRRMEEAADKGGPLEESLNQVGLSAVSLREKLPLDALEDIAEAFHRLPDHGKKVQLAFKLFDSEGVGMINLLNGGRKAIQDFRLEADRLGITSLTPGDVEAIADANDEINRLKTSVETLGQKAAVAFAPIVEGAASIALGITEAIHDMTKELDTFLLKSATFRNAAREMAGHIGENAGILVHNAVEAAKLAGNSVMNGGGGKFEADFKDLKKFNMNAIGVINAFGKDMAKAGHGDGFFGPTSKKGFGQSMKDAQRPFAGSASAMFRRNQMNVLAIDKEQLNQQKKANQHLMQIGQNVEAIKNKPQKPNMAVLGE